MSNKYGYIRVSTRDQNIERQLSAIQKEKIEEKNIYIDKKSGKDFKRDKYQKLIKKLKKGDELYIKSIDRLGRNYEEIINQWRQLTKEKEVDIIVLDFPLLDTRKEVKGITGKFIADLVLQILSYTAQIERENISQRQKEGIAEAQKRGIKFGRPKKERPENYKKIKEIYLKGEISLRKAGKILQVSPQTFKKWIEEDKK